MIIHLILNSFTRSPRLCIIMKFYKKIITSTSITRKKLIKLPKSKKAISDKCNYVTAIRTFNELPNEYKVLKLNEKNKNKIKKTCLVHNPIAMPQ